MANATLRKLVSAFGVQGEAAIDQLTKESGILMDSPAIPANKNISHTYKRIDALPSFSITTIGTGQADVTVNDNILQTDLKVLKAIQSEPIEIADSYPGGPEAMFRDDMPAFNEGYGQGASTQLIYGDNATFGDAAGIKGLHYWAKAYSNVTQMGGASGSRTSIFAVKFRPGRNGCGILFNPQVAAASGLMDVLVMNGGQPTLEVTNTTTGAKKPVYQVLYQSYLGLLSTSSFDIAAITQIQDATGKKPTSAGMDTMLARVKANPANTIIFMNRTSKRLVGELKNSKLQIAPSEVDFSNRVGSWDGVPIVIDDNILDTETTALD